MRPFVRAAPLTLSLSTVLLSLFLMLPAASAAAQEEAQVETENEVGAAEQGQGSPQEAAPCLESDEARQFDFWVGTWDVYNPEGEKAGVNVVERLLQGCLLLESWTGAGGSSGKSMNYWDPQRATWRQVWVSDRGSVLDYRHGEYRDGAMRFRGITIDESGDTTQQKLTFEAVAADTVRQVFEARPDGGATWDTTWVGIYVRRRGD